MDMRQVIRQRRRELGLTQEQVADYLGVTTPAVNKWEKGGTSPDIALLAPLARLLHTDMNTLFGFYGDLTKQELIRFCKALGEVSRQDGMAAAFDIAREKLREYPASEQLLYSVALQLQSQLITSGLSGEEQAPYEAVLQSWYERLAESAEPAIRNSACYMLAGRALAAGEPDRAQFYLDKMPDRKDTADKRLLQAELYLRKGEPEQAAKLLQTALAGAVGAVQMLLYKLVDMELAAENREDADYAAERTRGLAVIFDLSPYSGLVAPLQLALHDRDARRAVALLREMLDSLARPWSLTDSPLYRRVEASGGSTATLAEALRESLRQGTEYDWLREDESFLQLLEELP